MQHSDPRLSAFRDKPKAIGSCYKWAKMRRREGQINCVYLEEALDCIESISVWIRVPNSMESFRSRARGNLIVVPSQNRPLHFVKYRYRKEKFGLSNLLEQ